VCGAVPGEQVEAEWWAAAVGNVLRLAAACTLRQPAARRAAQGGPAMKACCGLVLSTTLTFLVGVPSIATVTTPSFPANACVADQQALRANSINCGLRKRYEKPDRTRTQRLMTGR
jgi:hypothetical protein